MNGDVLVTDLDWFQFLSTRPDLDEVNFWRLRDLSTPRQLVPGTPVLFKLRKKHGGFIAGYAVFAKHKVLPAWLAFGQFFVSRTVPRPSRKCSTASSGYDAMARRNEARITSESGASCRRSQ